MSGNQTIVTLTATLAAGTYVVLGVAYVWSAGVATLSLRKGGSIFGWNNDPRSVNNVQRFLFSTFTHTGGSVTLDIWHAQESGITQYGSGGDTRFGRHLQVFRIGS